MTRTPTFPFTLKRQSDVYSGSSITSTTETVHGLLMVEENHLRIQWRVARTTDHVGSEIRRDEEMESVRQVDIPLRGVAGAVVRRRWWQWPPGARLILRATDLRAFEDLAGEEGLRLDHPAELILPLRRKDRLAAEEFAAELSLVLAERALEKARRPEALEDGGD
jgi:hypothetical protein